MSNNTYGTTYRQEHTPLELIRTAIGPREAVEAKLSRVRSTLRLWRNPAEIRRRVKALRAAGMMGEMPSFGQLAVGTWDCFRYFLIPGSDDFYQQTNINFTFHQFLRWLDDPMSMIDPVGLFSERDTIIGHLLQVTHHNPVYDLQLLLMFPDGLDEMEKQLKEVIAGTHPRAQTLRATVERPGYFEDLLDYVADFKKNPKMNRLLRAGFFRIKSPAFLAAERTFSTLPGLMDYCLKLPRDPAELLKHLLFNREMPLELAIPESEAAAPPKNVAA